MQEQQQQQQRKYEYSTEIYWMNGWTNQYMYIRQCNELGVATSGVAPVNPNGQLVRRFFRGTSNRIIWCINEHCHGVRYVVHALLIRTTAVPVEHRQYAKSVERNNLRLPLFYSFTSGR